MGKKHKKHHKSEKTENEGEKSLKVVLKLGGLETSATSLEVNEYSGSERKHKHKKKKKKKSSDREKHREKPAIEVQSKHLEHISKVIERVKATPSPRHSPSPSPRPPRVVEEITAAPTPPPPKKARLHEVNPVVDLILDKRPRGLKEPPSNKALTALLNYLHRILSGKDVNGFFQYPVNDIIAPGYSAIIKHPIDYSTMKNKIDNGEYFNVMEYKNDFRLMCENAMLYNQPETIYYQAARKLLGGGLKHMTHERLLNTKNTLSTMQGLTMEDLGFKENDLDDAISIVEKFKPPKKIKPPKSSKFEAIPDNLSPKEILAQCQAAAAEAAEELTLRQPDSKIGFLRKQKDGTTTLSVLNPANVGQVSEKERVITLGQIVGKLNSGTGQINTFREDKRNKVTPVSYLDYGAFSSYAPSYDSSFASLCKEDSDLVLSAYGGDLGVQYATSMKRFTADSGDYVNRLADGLLNYLTKGEHSKTMKVLEEKRQEKLKQEQQNNLKETEPNTDDKESSTTVEVDKDKDITEKNVDLESLRSLKDIGIDVSFLDTIESEMVSSKVQDSLDASAGLIQNLEETQRERLSQNLPSHLAQVQGPGAGEVQLAERVTKNLTELAKQVPPGDIVSMPAIRSSMGITMDTITTDVQSQIDLQDDAQSQVLTHISHEDVGETDTADLQAFLDQGPSLRVCDSPSAPPKTTVLSQDGISDISSASDPED